MSAIARLKEEIRQRRQSSGSFNAFNPSQRFDENELTVLPKKPKNKTPLLVVDRESKRSLHRQSEQEKRKNGKGGVAQYEDDSSSDEDDGEEQKTEIKKIPWAEMYLAGT